MKIGEYVLGTRGGTGDPWAVGFYAGLVTGLNDRHNVTHEDGTPIRDNGYLRVRRVSKERGAWLLKHSREIEGSYRSWAAVLKLPMEDE